MSAETSVTEEPREGKLHARISVGAPSDRRFYRDDAKNILVVLIELQIQIEYGK